MLNVYCDYYCYDYYCFWKIAMTGSMNMNALTSSAYIDIMMTSFAISVSITLVSTTMSNHYNL